MLRYSDLDSDSVVKLIRRYRLSIEVLPDGHSINGSYWGEPEAGVVNNGIFVRADTPVHSLLHELSHVICMSPQRRATLEGDAGGDDAEECAVCYLQIVLANELAGVGSERLMKDMDEWGYSFRYGSAQRWFEEDAGDAEAWLRNRCLIRADGRPTFKLRVSG